MIDFDPQKALIFVHVPKTAGTAVRHVVQSWFPDRLYLHYVGADGQLPQRVALDSPAFEMRGPVIYGHFNKDRGFGVEDYYADASQFVTILRDPFELAISHYFFVRQVLRQSEQDSGDLGDSLEEHMASAKLNFLVHFPREMNLNNFKDIIEEFFVEIGTTEDLPRSLHLIARALGKEFEPSMLDTINASNWDQPAPDHLREALRERYPLEHAVYDFARARVENSPPQDTERLFSMFKPVGATSALNEKNKNAKPFFPAFLRGILKKNSRNK